MKNTRIKMKKNVATESTLYQDILNMLEGSGRLDMFNNLAKRLDMTGPDLIMDLVDDNIDVWDEQNPEEKTVTKSYLHRRVMQMLKQGKTDSEIKTAMLK